MNPAVVEHRPFVCDGITAACGMWCACARLGTGIFRSPFGRAQSGDELHHRTDEAGRVHTSACRPDDVASTTISTRALFVTDPPTDRASVHRDFDWVDALGNWVCEPVGEFAYRCFSRKWCRA